MPAPWYPMASQARTATSPIARRSPASTAGEGASSREFLETPLRRAVLAPPGAGSGHARRTAHEISMWRPRTIARSMMISSEPNAPSASERARRSAAARPEASPRTTACHRLPPPPARSFEMTGKPMRSAAAAALFVRRATYLSPARSARPPSRITDLRYRPCCPSVRAITSARRTREGQATASATAPSGFGVLGGREAVTRVE